MKKLLTIALVLASLAGLAQKKSQDQVIAEAWQSGRTLPIEIGKQYQPELISGIQNDNGYNVLIDIAHQCSFAYMWGLPGTLQSRGYRTISSQASLNTVLDAKGKCRLRIPYDTKNRIYPFAWYPNFKYNIVITQQGEPDAPAYTAAERKALVDWVKKGGSLYILASPVKPEQMESWSLNSLASDFGAKFTTDRDVAAGGVRYAVLDVASPWEVSLKGEGGKPIQARRAFGKGRVVVAGSLDDLQTLSVRKTDSQEKKDETQAINKIKNEQITKTMEWLAEGQKPVGGEPRMPQTMGGGGAIYPELEAGTESIVVFYTPNLNEKLLACVEKEIPSITGKIHQWLPSDPTLEPMYLILSAGGGGGWAVNAFKPKENGIISLDDFGLMSIYAHELAHTLGGPSNSDKVKAGRSPFHDQGEAHAGWFQGKIDAIYKPELQKVAVKNCGKYFEDPEFRELDIKRYANDPEYQAKFGKGKDWSKIWYIWQRMDDTYGAAWYPRWKMIQYDRWAKTPDRKLTWEESVEDMSIAVGEDLFPFFAALHTSLDRYLMGEVQYKGQTVKLPVANIPIIAPGKVRIEPIADYTKPLK